ncbi:aspartic proteinase nepenthesin-2 [Carex littledalei]|uniref:Aspartic proteinase nepenthesin-2 n=1 Tax=Carex littledalei TaxID=544730 RepID=A0A833V277_9POAL|nr:aspartic proteinase nepenthesin-2 [Carex littledalei]
MKTSSNLKFIVHIFISFVPLVILKASDIRLDLTHVDSGKGFTKLELVQRMTFRTNARTAALLTKSMKPTNPITVPVHPGNGDEPYDREYLVRFSIGTPPQPLILTLDTGSDLIWTQCLPCIQCFDQGLPFYNPANSSTFAYLSCLSNLCTALPMAACHQQCFYLYEYGDGSATVGSVSTETFTFGSKVTVPGISFGCGFLNGGIFVSNESGILGLGRGPVSLISQLGLGAFSYCFTSLFGSKSSPLLLGSPTNFYNNTVKSTTPLIQNQNPTSTSFYYLSLKGITVGKSLLRIPHSAFALQDDGTGGVIIDSGSAITGLNDDAYKLVRKAFIHQVKLPIANESMTYLDLCFTLPESLSGDVDVPKFVFHFENVDLELPRENYIYENRSAGELCLVMSSSGDTSTIIGNFQQQNIHILYDLENEKMSFMPAQCDKL